MRIGIVPASVLALGCALHSAAAVQFQGRGALRGDARGAIIGRVVSDAPELLPHPIEVRLEGPSPDVRARTYTDGLGNFTFGAAEAATASFIVIEAEGFRPVRQRLDATPAAVRGQMVTTVFLERLAPEVPPAGDDPNLVDLRQLRTDIPDQAVEAFEQAADASRQGDHEEAARRLERAVELSPDYYDAQYALGFEYLQLGRAEDAGDRFRTASELDPNAADPLINLGMLHLRENDVHTLRQETEAADERLADAVRVLDAAVEREPGSASARYFQGTALYRAGENRRALETLQRALGLTPPVPQVRIMLYNVHVAEREFERALEQLTLYLDENPDSADRESVERMKAELEQLLPR